MSPMTGRRWPNGTVFGEHLRLMPTGDVVVKGSWTLLGTLDSGTFTPHGYFLAASSAEGWELPEGWAEDLRELGAVRGPWTGGE